MYLPVAVLLPGTLVYRALRGSSGSLAEDLGLGGATGLLLLAAGWAVTTVTGFPALLPAWPLLIVAPFLAVPGLRRHWRIAHPRPAPAYWSWALAGAVTLAVLALGPAWRATPLPPAGASWYQDLYYHLALVREVMRPMPFQTPQVAGDTLRYHYLADADVATAALITRIDPATVLLRLWLPPIIALTALVTAALARQVTGRWQAGALGGVLAVAGLPLVLGAPIVALGGNAISYPSPSQSYQLPLTGLLLVLAVDVLRGVPIGRAWVLVFPLALACAGAKAGALPPIVAGLAAGAVAVAVRGRERLRCALVLFGLVLAAMLVGYRLFAGGGAGTLAVRPLAILFSLLPYRQTLGAYDANDGGLPAGVAHASAGGLAFVAALVIWWLVMQVGRLAGLALLGTGRARCDPAAWLLAGVTVAGAGGMWLFWHPSASQVYFWLGVLPAAGVLTVWLLADRAPGRRTVAAGLAAGAVWALLVPRLGGTPARTVVSWSLALLVPVLLTAAVTVVVAAVVLLARRALPAALLAGRGPAARRALPMVLLAAVLGAGVGGYAHNVAVALRHALRGPAAAKIPAVSRDEMAAARWLDRHAGPEDVVATNVHCLPFGPPGRCDARAFWVAALTGRRTLLGGWGYSDQAVAADGVGGKRYYLQPAPYPARAALNERVFAAGDPADVAALHGRYGVRWLFADARVGPVSARLAGAAVARHTAGPVTIYELVDAPE
ncbi:hypothetical protein ACQP2F_02195 [Actinoplanes sp. CA-030573]|uniref:hypothetical protein n=1 Tax=Actinoplanes sp. CA-030573 TaxID=3239898 RepID=UPI003D8E32C1